MGLLPWVWYGGSQAFNIVVLGYKVVGSTTELYVWGNQEIELVYTLPYAYTIGFNPVLKISVPDVSTESWHIYATPNRAPGYVEQINNPELIDFRFINSSGANILSASDFSLPTGVPVDSVVLTHIPFGNTTYVPFMSRTATPNIFTNSEMLNGVIGATGPGGAGIGIRGILPGLFADTDLSIFPMFQSGLQRNIVQTVTVSGQPIRNYTTAGTFDIITVPGFPFAFFNRCSYFGNTIYRALQGNVSQLRTDGASTVEVYSVTDSAVTLAGDASASVVAGSVPSDVIVIDAFVYPA